MQVWKSDMQNQMDTVNKLVAMGKFMGMDVLERITILGNVLSTNASNMTNHEVEKYKKFLESELQKVSDMIKNDGKKAK